MTLDVAWEGRTTWPADSRTITFHAGYEGETDIWTIPADRGTTTWLIGVPGFGDYRPAYSKDSRYVAYASFAPLPAAPLPAARQWIVAYTFDVPAGTWTEGVHPYHFEFEWSAPDPGAFTGHGGEFVVSHDASLYDEQVLLRGPSELNRVVQQGGPACQPGDAIHPLQPTRFLIGWLTDDRMTYPEALAHFDNIAARVVWDDVMSAELVRHEIRPSSSVDTWFQYVCTFTVRK